MFGMKFLPVIYSNGSDVCTDVFPYGLLVGH
jgi:hypothetical protein